MIKQNCKPLRDWHAYLDGLGEQDGGEEGDDERGQPLGGLLISERDAVRPEEEDGGAHAGDRQEPGEKYAPPGKEETVKTCYFHRDRVCIVRSLRKKWFLV